MIKTENFFSENTWLHILLITAAVVAVFGHSLSYEFVWDDNLLILEVDAYRDFRLKEILSSPVNRAEYLPVRDISYGVDFLLWGENPSGFHLSNIVFYALNCFVLYFMILEIASLLYPAANNNTAVPLKLTAFFTTLFFAVHPLHSEPVSFIMCRNVLLSGLFFFTSCYLFLRFLRSGTGEGKGYYGASIICFILAVFSKSTVIMLPLILLLFLPFTKRGAGRASLSVIPFFLIAAADFFIAKSIATGGGLISLDHKMVFGAFNTGSKLAVSLQIPFFYIMKLFVPVNLSVEYTTEFSRALISIKSILSFLALIFIFFSGIVLRKKYPEYLFSFLWFLIALIPVMNFFLTHPVVSDRYVYYSSFAILFPLTVILLKAASGSRRKKVIILFTCIALLLSVITVNRNRVWQSDETLWTDTIQASPDAAKPYFNLGSIYFARGDYERAFQNFAKLKEVYPISVAYEYYEGLKMFNEGNYESAINKAKKALTRNNESLKLNSLLGRSYEKTGNTEKAMESYMNILKSNEIDRARYKDSARERLSILRNSISGTLDSLRKKVNENKLDFDARIKLAITLDKAGLFDEAMANYSQLEKLAGDNWVLFYNMANIYKKTEDYEKAVIYYDKSLNMNRKNVDAYNNLGLALKKLEKYDLSIEAFENAIKADQNNAYAPFNLAVTHFHLGNKESALKYFNLVRDRFPQLKGRTTPYIKELNTSS